MIPEGITKNLLIINSTQVTNGATASASFDTRGFDYAVVNLFMTGGTAAARTAAATSVKVEQSDDDSAYVSASLTSGTDFTVATNGTATVSTADIPYYTFNIDTRGLRRYLKLTVVPSTTVGIQAVATLGRKSIGTLSVGSGSTDARNIVSV
jgi:hypothetical protein